MISLPVVVVSLPISELLLALLAKNDQGNTQSSSSPDPSMTSPTVPENKREMKIQIKLLFSLILNFWRGKVMNNNGNLTKNFAELKVSEKIRALRFLVFWMNETRIKDLFYSDKQLPNLKNKVSMPFFWARVESGGKISI